MPSDPSLDNGKEGRPKLHAPWPKIPIVQRRSAPQPLRLFGIPAPSCSRKVARRIATTDPALSHTITRGLPRRYILFVVAAFIFRDGIMRARRVLLPSRRDPCRSPRGFHTRPENRSVCPASPLGGKGYLSGPLWVTPLALRVSLTAALDRGCAPHAVGPVGPVGGPWLWPPLWPPPWPFRLIFLSALSGFPVVSTRKQLPHTLLSFTGKPQ